MQVLVLLAAAAAAAGAVREKRSLCLDLISCQENSKRSLMECVHLCESTLDQTIPPDESELESSSEPLSLPSPQSKRSYSMQHFRWGKPVGRKRRPVKIYTTSNGVEEESAEIFPAKMERRELPRGAGAGAGGGNELEMEDGSSKEEREEEPDDMVYKMKHFRWGGPPASKRYGGFMKSWSQHSKKPLISLLKTVINKEEEDGEEGELD